MEGQDSLVADRDRDRLSFWLLVSGWWLWCPGVCLATKTKTLDSFRGTSVCLILPRILSRAKTPHMGGAGKFMHTSNEQGNIEWAGHPALNRRRRARRNRATRPNSGHTRPKPLRGQTPLSLEGYLFRYGALRVPIEQPSLRNKQTAAGGQLARLGPGQVQQFGSASRRFVWHAAWLDRTNRAQAQQLKLEGGRRPRCWRVGGVFLKGFSQSSALQLQV